MHQMFGFLASKTIDELQLTSSLSRQKHWTAKRTFLLLFHGVVYIDVIEDPALMLGCERILS